MPEQSEIEIKKNNIINNTKTIQKSKKIQLQYNKNTDIIITPKSFKTKRFCDEIIKKMVIL